MRMVYAHPRTHKEVRLWFGFVLSAMCLAVSRALSHGLGGFFLVS